MKKNHVTVVRSFNPSVKGSTYNDDVLLKLGSDSDIVMLNRSTILAADTALTGVLIGTPDTSAIAANSLILANATEDGDILMAINDGGTSRQFLFMDGSTGILNLGMPATPSHAVAAGAVVFGGGNVEFTGNVYFRGGTYYYSPASARFEDDIKLRMGSGTDYWFIYNSTGTALELWATNADGGGTDGLVFSVQDGVDDIVFAGAVSAGNGLASFDGAVTNITIVNGIVTAAS